MTSEVVYLTGASGFVGQHLQRLLPARGVRKIVTVGRSGSDLDYATFAKAELEADSAVIHLAGQAHDLHGSADEARYEAANVALTRDVYEAFRASKARTFIFFSSVKAVSDAPAGILRENDEPHPTTPYGRSKLRAEQYLAGRPPEPGQELYVLRPCVVVGPGVKGNFALLNRLIRARIPYPLGAFANQRSVLSIDNLEFVVTAALKGDLPPGTYNLADDEPLSTVDMVRTLAAAHGRSPKIWPIPVSVVKALARAGDVLPLPLNSLRLQKLTESYVVDNAALKSGLGVERLPVSPRGGLIHSVVHTRQAGTSEGRSHNQPR
ncbi:NAD-dependent epimerase/dehydratase family protein [Nostocoides sp. HKS02]|uniref:NAD-dependent epimerase/dehydratase family protein n=1 Tax=Nostocoides sp. HKS02 TaxID=1813880 RepID=UPI0012B4A0A3|nr:NAD-dependent epimerase/dehydratase family protein [Tetrasphaera sp. HKS02]QGN57950.1 NAD-dependent epimerase/dehydratase family protein [Tetrasphaera sp. HKS02]